MYNRNILINIIQTIEHIYIISGIRQEDLFTCLMLNIIMDEIISKIRLGKDFKIGDREIKYYVTLMMKNPNVWRHRKNPSDAHWNPQKGKYFVAYLEKRYLLNRKRSHNIRQSYSIENINKWVLQRKIQWNQHMSRMTGHKLIKNARDKSNNGTYCRSRLRKRSSDNCIQGRGHRSIIEGKRSLILKLPRPTGVKYLILTLINLNSSYLTKQYISDVHTSRTSFLGSI